MACSCALGRHNRSKCCKRSLKSLDFSWISLRITTDLGRQFESSIFKELTKLLGVKHLRTTPYHPQANGIIERWHRTLKSGIKCYETNYWSTVLPLILLGMRSTLKADIKLSPAEMVFGTSLRIPGAFLVPSKDNTSETDFVQSLRRLISNLPTTKPVRHGVKASFVQPALAACKYAFVRIDHVKTPLEPNYEGPFEVVSKHDKYFVLKMHQRNAKISIDRLKSAYIFNDENVPTENALDDNRVRTNDHAPQDVTLQNHSPPLENNDTPDDDNSVQIPRTTSSGRHVRIPLKYR